MPVRLEVGPKDIEKNQVVLVRRDNHEKAFVPMNDLAETVKALLDAVHEGMLARALAFREEKTVDATDFEQLKAGVSAGFVRAMWCGERACEDEIKAKTGATTRCMPLEADAAREQKLGCTCVHCGKKAKAMAYFAKAY